MCRLPDDNSNDESRDYYRSKPEKRDEPAAARAIVAKLAATTSAAKKHQRNFHIPGQRARSWLLVTLATKFFHCSLTLELSGRCRNA